MPPLDPLAMRERDRDRWIENRQQKRQTGEKQTQR